MSQSSLKSGASRPSPEATHLEPRKEDGSDYNYGWTSAKFLSVGKYGDLFKMSRSIRTDRRRGRDANKEQQIVVVKALRLGGANEMPWYVDRETRALKVIYDHPQKNDRLIELLDWFVCDNKKLGGWHFCLVFPHFPTDLYKIICNIQEGKAAPWSEKRVKNFTLQSLEGIAFLHDLGLVHRDIKPDNILVDSKGKGEDIFKITDFGYTRELPENEKTISIERWAGTREYCSPEQLKNTLGYCCDIWSLGVTILEFCNRGVPPWELEELDRTSESDLDEEEKKDRRIKNKIRAEKLSKEIINDGPRWNSEAWEETPEGELNGGVKPYSKDAKKFIKKLLEKDHKKRPTAKEALEEDWLKVHDDSSHARPPPTHVGSDRNAETKSTASTASRTGRRKDLEEQMSKCSLSRTNSPSAHDKITHEATQKKPEQKTAQSGKSEGRMNVERRALESVTKSQNKGSIQPSKLVKHKKRK